MARLFTEKNGWLFSVAAHLSAEMRVNPIAVVIADGLKITVPPPDSSREHLLNMSMLKSSFWYPSLCLQFLVVSEEPKYVNWLLTDQYLFLHTKLLIMLFPPFLCICLCIWLQHYMSASTAGCKLDYVSNSKHAIAVKGFWLYCHVSLAPLTFDSRESTKGKKKMVLNKSLCSKRCIVFVCTGFRCGRWFTALLTVEFTPVSPSWSIRAWDPCVSPFLVW